MGTVEALQWLYKKGMQDKENGNYEKSRQRFQEILDMTRDSRWVKKANAALAEVYTAEDNYFWAMDHIRRALKRSPNCAEYRYIKGKIHFERQEWKRAASEGLKAVEDDLENSNYYQLLGKAAYKCDGYKLARRFLNWAVQCSPHEVEPRLELARLEIKEKNFQRALEVLKKAIDKTEENEKIRNKIRIIQENWEITGS